MARGRLRDAEVLLAAGRYDGAMYLCGYTIEAALKARICRVLKWPGYPSTSRGYQSFRTHDLDILLHLSGTEDKIKTNHLAEWSIVATWDSNVRYRPIGSTSSQDAVSMIQSTKVILGVL